MFPNADVDVTMTNNNFNYHIISPACAYQPVNHSNSNNNNNNNNNILFTPTPNTSSSVLPAYIEDFLTYNTYRQSLAAFAIQEAEMEQQFQLHQRYEENGSENETDNKRSHICGICHKGFTRRGNLTRHIKLHSGVKPFHCDECDKRFASKGNLKTHSIIHSKPSKVYCEYCGRPYSRQGFLDRHVEQHLAQGHPKQQKFVEKAQRWLQTFFESRKLKEEEMKIPSPDSHAEELAEKDNQITSSSSSSASSSSSSSSPTSSTSSSAISNSIETKIKTEPTDQSSTRLARPYLQVPTAATTIKTEGSNGGGGLGSSPFLSPKLENLQQNIASTASPKSVLHIMGNVQDDFGVFGTDQTQFEQLAPSIETESQFTADSTGEIVWMDLEE